MNKKRLILFLTFFLSISLANSLVPIETSNDSPSPLRHAEKKVDSATNKRLDKEKDKTGIPLFIKNNGQWNSDILFRARLAFADLYIRKNGISMVKIDSTPFEKEGHYHGKTGEINGVRVDMNFDKANPEITFIPKKRGDVPYHFILPSTVSHTSYAYAMVYAKSVYEGIDWRIYTTIFGEIKHEFLLQPGADIKKIKLLFDGQNELLVSNNKLEIKTPYGSIFEKPPYSFYLNNHEIIPTRYIITDDYVQFELPESYDTNQHIVIDPTLIFSTFSNASARNWGYTGTYGENGSAYSAGIVFDVGFPASAGSFQTRYDGSTDIGISKYDATGSNLLFATYLGGSGMDIPHSILMDQDNHLLIFGSTTSTNFPTTPNVFQQDLMINNKPFVQIPVVVANRSSDIFLARLSSTGDRLMTSTYIGGTRNDGINFPYSQSPSASPIFILIKRLYFNYGDSYRGDLAIDKAGDIYVSSVTDSSDFPTINAFQNTFGGGFSDGILFKMNKDMNSLLWSTYVGGNRKDTLYNMKVNDDNLIVCGGTLSTDSFLPTTGKFKAEFSGVNTPNTVQADGLAIIVEKNTGNITDATYLGTTSPDQAYFIDTDQDGNIFVLGQTLGNYPRTSDTYGAMNAGLFLQKLSPDLSTGLLSTTLGIENSSSQPNISPTAFLVSDCGDIYITGFGGFHRALFSIPTRAWWATWREVRFTSTTVGLPVTDDAYQSETDGNDFYLMILSKDAKKLNYATFFGGDDPNKLGEHVDGGTNRFDKKGVVYHAVCGGCEGSTYPTTKNAYSTVHRSNFCNNAFFKFDLKQLLPQFTTNTPDFNNPNIKRGCTPFSLIFSNTTNGNGAFEWDFGDGTRLTRNDKTEVSHVYDTPGVYTVTLTAKSEDACAESNSVSAQITVEKEEEYEIASDATICLGESFDLFITRAKNITWIDIDTGTLISSQPRTKVSPIITTAYELKAVLGTNCQIYKKITITVLPHLSASFDLVIPPSKNKNATSICLDLASGLSGLTVEFENNSTNGVSYIWNFGDGESMNTNEKKVSHSYQMPGSYTVQLTARNPSSCEREAISERTFEIKEISTHAKITELICLESPLTLSAPNIINPSWYINEKKISSSAQHTVLPMKETTYTAKGTSANGCSASQLIEVKLTELNLLEIVKKHNNTCFSEKKIEFELMKGEQKILSIDNLGGLEITHNMGDGVTYDTPHVVHEYRNNGVYTISTVIKQKDCIIEKTTRVTIPNIYIPNVITPNGDNKNDKFIIRNDKDVSLAIYDRWGNKVFESENYQNDWPSENKKYNGVFNYQVTIERGETCNGWFEVRS